MYKYSYSALQSIAMYAIQHDDNIQSYARRLCGGALAVISEMPTEDPPTEGDCPLVAFSPIGGSLGQGEDEFIREIAFRLAIQVDPSTDVTDTMDESGRVVRRDFSGTATLTDLLEMIYDSLAEAFNLRDIQLTSVGETIESAGLGLYQARGELGFHLPACIGERRPDEDEQN